MQKPGIQTDIAGLRALSVVMVVLYHFNLRVLGGGFIGVDVFFVISGYLMTRIIFDAMVAGRFHYGHFLLKRGQRIVPALLAMMLTLLAAGALLLPPVDLASLGNQSLRAALFVSNSYYAAQQGYFSAGIDDRWLLHTWSLSVEWQFYMLYPLIVWLGVKLAGNAVEPRRARLVTGWLAAVAAASLALCVLSDQHTAFFSVATRSWQMIAGGLVFLCRPAGWLRAVQGKLLSFAGLAVIVATAVVVNALHLSQQWPGWYAVMPVVGACMVLMARCEDNPLLNNRIMQHLGAWSYSIYLWHWPIVIALSLTGMMDEASRMAKLIGLPLSLLLGYLSYRYIEPMRWLRAVPVMRATAVLGAATVAVLVVAGGYAAKQGLDMRTRDPALFQNLRAAAEASTYAPECENQGTAHDKFCHLNQGAPGARVLVLGDSHAGHLYAWFQAHSKSDTTFFVKSGCPAIPGFERTGTNAACSAYSAEAYRLAASGTYQTVIVSQNWIGFGPGSSGICSDEGGRCVTSAKSATPNLPLDRMRETLQGLLDRGVRVVVVDATPYFNFNVPRTLARQLFWHGDIEAHAATRGLTAQTAPYDQLFAELRAHPAFSVVSLRKELCEGEMCTIYDERNRMSVYADRDHLNPAWIVLHGQQFLPFVATSDTMPPHLATAKSP
jgi:peptidoglycan/LPS O-acetylase OafA/YrhL